MSLTKSQAIEVAKCNNSCAYFLGTFAWIMREASSSILPFNLLPYQNEIIEALESGTNLVVNKSRRIGWSWIIAGIAVHIANFKRGSKVLLLSRREKDAIDVLDKCKFIMNNLAEHDSDDINRATHVPWLLGEIIVSNQTEVSRGWRDKTGKIYSASSIISLTNSDQSGRGAGASHVFLDEFAFYENSWKTWRAISKATMGGGVFAVGSSPNGIGNKFHQLVMMGRLKKNIKNGKELFHFMEVHWRDSWMSADEVDEDKATSTEDDAMQEWELEFLTPGNTVFDPTHLAACYKPPDEYPEVGEYLEKYHDAVMQGDGEKIYYSGADTALGKVNRKSNQKDYHVFIPLTDAGVQAACYSSQEPIDKWAGHVMNGPKGERLEVKGSLSKRHAEYPGILKIEEQGGGNTAYTNHVLPDDAYSDIEIFHQSQKTKSGSIKRMQIAINTHQVIFTELETYMEFQIFQDNGPGPNRYSAPSGFNDDHVMAFLAAHENMLKNGGVAFDWGDDITALKRAVDGGDIANVEVDKELYGPSTVSSQPFPAQRLTDLIEGVGRIPQDVLDMPDIEEYLERMGKFDGKNMR